MIFKVILKAAAFILFCVAFISSYEYVVILRDENIFSPCDMEDVTFVDDYMDMSGMSFTALENGSVHFHGYTVVIRDFGLEANPATIQIFKKSRDKWVDTIYNLQRKDFCISLFDPIEMWSVYLAGVPKEDKVCPLSKGRKYYLDTVTDMKVSMQDPRLAGEYKLHIVITLPEFNEVFCANVIGEIYRK